MCGVGLKIQLALQIIPKLTVGGRMGGVCGGGGELALCFYLLWLDICVCLSE